MNSIVERKTRTIEDSARCMLQQARLPGWFWPEAVNTAVYIRNHYPTKAVAGRISYEVYIGRKPSLSHLRIFGCKAYAHLHQQQRSSRKFAPRARQCILLGQVEGSTSIYKLFDVNKKTVLNSWSVVFDEHTFPEYVERYTTEQAAETAEAAKAANELDEVMYDTIHVRTRGAPAPERMHAESNKYAIDRQSTTGPVEEQGLATLKTCSKIVTLGILAMLKLISKLLRKSRVDQQGRSNTLATSPERQCALAEQL
jgi:hypothetical protein